MPSFGKSSTENLSQCHSDLQLLFNIVVRKFDCSVICGSRTETEQNRTFLEGKSTLKYPESFHNLKPSLAVDVCPYPINWQNHKRFYFFAGYVKHVAESLGIKIRWGGDWDGDTIIDDQNFNDLPHFELV